MNEIVKIPKLEDILAETPQTRDEDKLTVILNQNPPEKWLRAHWSNPKIKVLPIERVEWLLNYIFGFGGWSEHIIDRQQMANSIVITLRLFVTHPITGKELSFDGIGAWALSTEKGASAMDITKLQSNAVMLASPAAKSEALKDAAHMLGKIFGANLNRAEDIAYDSILPKMTTLEEITELYKAKKEFLHPDTQKNIERIINNNESTSFDKIKKVLEATGGEPDKNQKI